MAWALRVADGFASEDGIVINLMVAAAASLSEPDVFIAAFDGGGGRDAQCSARAVLARMRKAAKHLKQECDDDAAPIEAPISSLSSCPHLP